MALHQRRKHAGLSHQNARRAFSPVQSQRDNSTISFGSEVEQPSWTARFQAIISARNAGVGRRPHQACPLNPFWASLSPLPGPTRREEEVGNERMRSVFPGTARSPAGRCQVPGPAAGFALTDAESIGAVAMCQAPAPLLHCHVGTFCS